MIQKLLEGKKFHLRQEGLDVVERIGRDTSGKMRTWLDFFGDAIGKERTRCDHLRAQLRHEDGLWVSKVICLFTLVSC